MPILIGMPEMNLSEGYSILDPEGGKMEKKFWTVGCPFHGTCQFLLTFPLPTYMVVNGLVNYMLLPL